MFDLLHPKNDREKLDVKENAKEGYFFVVGLTEVPVKSAHDMIKVLKVGQRQRRVGATAMNEGSSRSHCILTIIVETSEKVEGNVIYRTGKLNLVDLAGSERQKKTGATGERLQEAKHINQSLSALGNVINALVTKKGVVPYRDSKLTRLLKDSLGGNTKTVSPVSGRTQPSFMVGVCVCRADHDRQRGPGGAQLRGDNEVGASACTLPSAPHRLCAARFGTPTAPRTSRTSPR